MFKDTSSLFASDENIIYVFDTDNFLNEEKEYKLTITNLVSGNVISSQTKLIHDLNIKSPNFDSPVYRMGFVSSQSGDFASSTIKLEHSTNAAICQMTLFVNYIEYGIDGSIDTLTIQKVYPLVEYSPNNDYTQQITGEEFFNLLAYNISSSTTVNRRVNNLDLLFSVGTSDLNTYIHLNEPPTGIVQERNLFTNIDGGIGLFTARNNKIQENILITTTTKEAIATHLDSLNFMFP